MFLALPQDFLCIAFSSEGIVGVFGILKNLDPTIWLRRFLGEAVKGRDFTA
jgi:hypothetical protein